MRDGRGWKALRVEEVEAVPWRGSELTWRPLRRALGTRIAGMAAYTAERAGQEVVEAHVESRGGRGHEELYVVLAGRASFTLDGTPLDAPAGTFVRVAPDVHRHATAAEPGTAVLAVGGPANFVPSGSEWIERARPHLHTDPERAAAILADLRAAQPDSPAIGIGEALVAVARGDEPAAKRALAAVLAEHPEVRETVRDTEPELRPLLWMVDSQ